MQKSMMFMLRLDWIFLKEHVVCVAYCLSFVLCIIAFFVKFYMQRHFCTHDFIMKLCFCFLCFKALLSSLTLFLGCKITEASLLCSYLGLVVCSTKKVLVCVACCLCVEFCNFCLCFVSCFWLHSSSLWKNKGRYLNWPLSFVGLQLRLNWFSDGGLLDSD